MCKPLNGTVRFEGPWKAEEKDGELKIVFKDNLLQCTGDGATEEWVRLSPTSMIRRDVLEKLTKPWTEE